MSDVSRQTTDACQVHLNHIPSTHLNERYLVWPAADGGPDTPENTVIVCATGVRNTEKLLALLRLSKGQVVYADLRTFAFGERALAKLAYARIQRQAM